MKRLTAIVLMLLMLAGLCACGSKTADRAVSGMAYDNEGYDESPAEDILWDTEAAMPEEGAAVDEGFSVGTGSASASDAASQNGIDVSKIIYSCRAEIETLSFDDCCAAVDEMVRRAGGFLEASTVRGGYYYSDSLRTAEYTIRLPRESFDEVTENLSALGHVSYRSISAENVGASYRDTESRLSVYRTEEERLLEMLEKADTVEDMLNIEDRLADVRYQIESLTTDLRAWDSLIQYSTLNLTVEEVEKYTEEPELGYWQKIGRGFVNTLRGVGDFFAELFSLVLIALPVLVLLGAAALVIVLLVRGGKKRRAAREARPYAPQSYTAPDGKADGDKKE